MTLKQREMSRRQTRELPSWGSSSYNYCLRALSRGHGESNGVKFERDICSSGAWRSDKAVLTRDRKVGVIMMVICSVGIEVDESQLPSDRPGTTGSLCDHKPNGEQLDAYCTGHGIVSRSQVEALQDIIDV